MAASTASVPELQKDLVGERIGDKQLRENGLRFIMKMVRHVHQPLRLLLERHDHARVTMPELQTAATGYEIEKLPSIGVIHPRAAALDEHERLPAVGVHYIIFGNPQEYRW